MPAQPAGGPEETSRRILATALECFRAEGFEKTTMREIARRAGVATGAAYYYFDSKEAIVAPFYRTASEEIEPQLAQAVARTGGLEVRLRALINVKLTYFGPHREILRAILRAGADPAHPLSPFSSATREIRDADIEWFRRLLEPGGTPIPRDLAPHLPRILWMYQMGIIFFWLVDDSHGQRRTARLLASSSRIVTTLIRLSSLPLMRPARKSVLELVEIIQGE